MKLNPLLALVFAAAFATPALAGPGKTYPVVGTAVEVDSQYVVVESEGKKVQVDRVGATQITGDLKVGDKVSAEYTMVAKEIKVTSSAKPATPAVAPAPVPAAPAAPKPATPPTAATPPAPPAAAPLAPAPAPKPAVKSEDTDEDGTDGEVPTKKEVIEKGKEKAGGLLDGMFKK